MEKDKLIAQLLDISWQKNPHLGIKESKLPNFMFSHRCHRNLVEHTLYEPCVVFVLQGTKRVHFGESLFTYSEGEFLAMTAPVPGDFCVGTEAFSAVTMMLDQELLCEVCQEVGPLYHDSALPAMTTAQCPEDILECLLRILKTEDCEYKRKHLFKVYMRELYILLLHSEAGQFLWQLSYNDTANYRILKIIAYIRQHFTEVLHMDELAEMAHMSLPTFFRRFRQLTLNSPLQYQKALQLHYARSLVFQQHLSMAQVAAEVGYPSHQQFTREYKRFFGLTPSLDLLRMLEEYAPQKNVSPYAPRNNSSNNNN